MKRYLAIRKAVVEKMYTARLGTARHLRRGA